MLLSLCYGATKLIEIKLILLCSYDEQPIVTLSHSSVRLGKGLETVLLLDLAMLLIRWTV